MYDLATDVWSEIKQMPTARGFLIDNKIYVIGGGYPDYKLEVEAYNSATDS